MLSRGIWGDCNVGGCLLKLIDCIAFSSRKWSRRPIIFQYRGSQGFFIKIIDEAASTFYEFISSTTTIIGLMGYAVSYLLYGSLALCILG